nr:hypothetical protein [Amycolatopsis sp. CA-128772]
MDARTFPEPVLQPVEFDGDFVGLRGRVEVSAGVEQGETGEIGGRDHHRGGVEHALQDILDGRRGEQVSRQRGELPAQWTVARLCWLKVRDERRFVELPVLLTAHAVLPEGRSGRRLPSQPSRRPT